MKRGDRIALHLVVSVMLLLWLSVYIVKPVRLIAIWAPTALAVNLLLILPVKNRRTVSYGAFTCFCAVAPIEEVRKLTEEALCDNVNVLSAEGAYIDCTKEGKTFSIFLHAKGGEVPAGEAAAHIRRLNDGGITDCVIICEKLSGRAAELYGFYGINPKTISLRRLYKRLYAAGSIAFIESKRVKHSIRGQGFFEKAFCPSHAPAFIYATLFMAAFSFITPLKLYYVLCASLSGVCAILCLSSIFVRGKGKADRLLK